jgi:hypothetical protein
MVCDRDRDLDPDRDRDPDRDPDRPSPRGSDKEDKEAAGGPDCPPAASARATSPGQGL